MGSKKPVWSSLGDILGNREFNPKWLGENLGSRKLPATSLALVLGSRELLRTWLAEIFGSRKRVAATSPAILDASEPGRTCRWENVSARESGLTFSGDENVSRLSSRRAVTGEP